MHPLSSPSASAGFASRAVSLAVTGAATRWDDSPPVREWVLGPDVALRPPPSPRSNHPGPATRRIAPTRLQPFSCRQPGGGGMWGDCRARFDRRGRRERSAKCIREE